MSAVLSDCGRYRYELTRQWGPDPGRRVCWIMLNPSTADAIETDQTLEKCVGFSQRWGYDGLVLVNLFAWRATDPRQLGHADDPVGPDNWAHVEAAVTSSPLVVVAWGNKGESGSRAMLNFLTVRGIKPMCLGITAKAEPRHPCRLAYATELRLLRNGDA
jgi:hypothetical protein